MTVRAKFAVNSIERFNTSVYADGKSTIKECQNIKLSAVCGNSDENKQFFASTPSGQLQLGTVNVEAAAKFELGKEYYIDFTPAG
jgi:hypothetical protein